MEKISWTDRVNNEAVLNTVKEERNILHTIRRRNHVTWIPCHHGMARPHIAEGGDGHQLWRAAANILKKQSRTAANGLSSSLWVGRGANHSSP
jgi:hypothetical protein